MKWLKRIVVSDRESDSPYHWRVLSRAADTHTHTHGYSYSLQLQSQLQKSYTNVLIASRTTK